MIRKLLLSAASVLLSVGFSLAQNAQVSGIVVDTKGTPIVGVTVMVEGTITGAITDSQGKYSVKLPDSSDKYLRFSSLGYIGKLVEIGGRTWIDVTLEEDIAKIDEVVVVAFGTTTKEAFTGSATVIKSEDIQKRQVSNVANALSGAVAGVQVSNSSGDPMSGEPDILIRGIGTMYAESAPLYVVDGVPYYSSLSNLNTSDIEFMTVLKDAASTALYGSRGANGVILITTKRAKSGEATITFDAKWGANSRATKLYDYVTDPAQYYELHYSALNNYYRNTAGLSAMDAHIRANELLTSNETGGLGYQVFSVPEGEYFIGTNGKVNPNATLGNKVVYNGQEYLLYPDDYTDGYKTTLRQEYNLSMSASNDRANVYASMGYLSNNGIVENSEYKRYTGRIRADYQAKKWLKIGGNAAFTHTDAKTPMFGTGAVNSNVFYFMNRTAPIYPLYIRDGEGNIMVDEHGLQMYDWGNGANAGCGRPVFTEYNPLQSLSLDTYSRDANSFSGTAFADVKLFKDLTATVNIGTNFDDRRTNQLHNTYYGIRAGTGLVSVSDWRSLEINTQELLNYSHVFGDKHQLSVLAGHEFFDSKSYYLYGSSYKLFSNDNAELPNGVIDGGAASSYRSDYNVEGWLGRIEYNYDSRITLSGSYRRDASSVFHPDHRWGNFWSASAAWLINHESWFKATWVSMLKLKASIGSQGNDGLDNWLYTDMYLLGANDGEVALSYYLTGNKELTWETNTNINAGVDFELFNGRLGGTVEYFNRKTTDLLNFFYTAPSGGSAGYYDNIGDMRNRGVEIELHGSPIRTRNFTWTLSMNMSHYKNRVTRVADANKISTVEGYSGYASGSYYIGEGLSYYTWYMPTFAGVDHSTGQSLWYKDVLDDDGNVTGRETTSSYSEATYYLNGTAIPDVYGGFSTSFEFFGVDISAQFAYQIGGKGYDQGYATSMSSPNTTVGYNYHKDLLKAWTPENPDSDIPRLQYGDQYTGSLSSRFLTDASYLNISSITVGYTLPRSFTSKLGLSKLRVYLACDNVYYWSKREGFDPRQSYAGTTSSYTYNPIRTISGGINVQF